MSVSANAPTVIITVIAFGLVVWFAMTNLKDERA